MDFEKIKDLVKRENWPAYRVAQIKDAIYSAAVADWDGASNLPADIKTILKKEMPLLSFVKSKIKFSQTDRAAKALLTLTDGLKIETVLMKNGKNWSVCVSTQVGCAVGCSFCYTGKMGFKRHLTWEEISDQVLFWTQELKKQKLDGRVSHVVFMGMGEPLLNYLNTVKAVKEISEADRLNIGMRHISVSTSGIADKFHAFATDLPQVNLALSLHSADDAERNRIVPVNRKFNLETIKKELEKYLAITGRQVFIEYTVVPGLNDRPEHIRLLGKWINGFKDHYLLHVNLIACNSHKAAPDEKTVKLFAKGLQGLGIGVTIRKSMGVDISAACGQLAGR